MDIRAIGDLFQQVGSSNAMLIVITFAIGWFFIRILPKPVERLVTAIENLGKTFAVQDERSAIIFRSVSGLQEDLRELTKVTANQADIIRLHTRLDDHFVVTATKEDVKLIIDALAAHTRDCQVRSNLIQRDILGGANK